MTVNGAPNLHQAPSSKEFDGIRHDDERPTALRGAFLQGCRELLLQHGFDPFVRDHRVSVLLLSLCATETYADRRTHRSSVPDRRLATYGRSLAAWVGRLN